jgi:hypothetical protein
MERMRSGSIRAEDAGYNQRQSVADSGRAVVLSLCKSKLPSGIRHPNLFLLPGGEASQILVRSLCDCLRDEFPVYTFDMELPATVGNSTPAECSCIAVDSSQPERVRDAIKKRLWLVRQQARPQTTMQEILQGRHRKTVPELRIGDYGVFFPSRTRRFEDVRTHSFDHTPGFYRYRLALARTVRLPKLMAHYLHGLFTDCPNHLFRGTTFRASRVRRSGLGVEISLTRLKDHDIIALADESRGHEFLSSRHENLQKYFLECDPTTVACEVPVWMESWEFEDYSRIFGCRDTLTGHIDVLRIEPDGLIGVWDFKPRAAAERDAHIQVFLYALMLALRTGLPLSAFTCGYFDENDAYVFRPTDAHLIA